MCGQKLPEKNTWWQFVLSAKKTKPALSSCVLERAKETKKSGNSVTCSEPSECGKRLAPPQSLSLPRHPGLHT